MGVGDYYSGRFKSGSYNINPLDSYVGLPDPGKEIFAKPPPSGLPAVSAEDQQASRDLMAQLAQYNQQYGQAYKDQSRLGDQLDGVIAGTAPSVAQAQLAQGVGQIRQQQDSQASGATGQNAVIARIAAMDNTGQAQADANQHAALVRAVEIQQARQQRAQIAGQQANEAGGMYGTSLGGAVGFAKPAADVSIADEQLRQKQFEDNRQFWGNMAQAAGKAFVAG